MKKFYISGNSAMRIPINSTGEAANSQKDGSVGAARWGGVCGIVPGKRIGRSRSAVPGRERRFSEGGAGRGGAGGGGYTETLPSYLYHKYMYIHLYVCV